MKQSFLYRFTNPDIYTNQEDRRIARVFISILIATFLGLSLLVTYRFISDQNFLLPVMLGFLTCIIIVTIFVHKGFLTLSSISFLWILLAFLSYLMVQGDGIHDTAMFAIPGIMIAGSLVLKRWYFVLYCSVVLFIILSIGYLEITRVIVNHYSTRTNIFDIIDVIIILSIITITVRLLADTQLQSYNRAKESEQRFRAIIDGIPDALFIAGQDGRFIEANNAALNQLGYTREELMRLNVVDIVQGSEATRARERIAGLGQASGLFETHHVRKDGEIIPVEVSLVRMMADGKPAVAGLARNIADRKVMELRFLRSQRMESIGTLAGGIAHDLNNVLAPILLSIQVLNRKITDPSSKQTLHLIEETTKRGSELIKQVLSFARGIDGERTIVQMGYIIEELAKIIRETFPRSIQLFIRMQKNLPTIHGDATQLHQVMMNLCVNARDAMPFGGMLELKAEIEIADEEFTRTNIDARPGPYLVISVGDTGSGIPKEIMEKIFDPFFTTKEVGIGTGLGLSTVHAIVKSHNGFIKVKSDVGKGTIFKVYFPTQIGELADTQHEEADLPAGNGELILVVDDEASIREITKSTLETYGYNVVMASDGSEALKIYLTRMGEISLIVTDMMMPNMSGATLIAEVQKVNPRMKVVTVSGQQQDLEQFNSNRILFLNKPYTSEQLLTMINTLLKQR